MSEKFGGQHQIGMETGDLERCFNYFMVPTNERHVLSFFSSSCAIFQFSNGEYKIKFLDFISFFLSFFISHIFLPIHNNNKMRISLLLLCIFSFILNSSSVSASTSSSSSTVTIKVLHTDPQTKNNFLIQDININKPFCFYSY